MAFLRRYIFKCRAYHFEMFYTIKINKSPTLYGIKRFITLLHRSPPLVPNPTDTNPVHTFYPIYLRLIFILNLRPAIQTVFFLQVFLPKCCTYGISCFSYECHMSCPSHPSFSHPKISGKEYKLMKLFNTLSFPTKLILCSSVNVRN